MSRRASSHVEFQIGADEGPGADGLQIEIVAGEHLDPAAHAHLRLGFGHWPGLRHLRFGLTQFLGQRLVHFGRCLEPGVSAIRALHVAACIGNKPPIDLVLRAAIRAYQSHVYYPCAGVFSRHILCL